MALLGQQSRMKEMNIYGDKADFFFLDCVLVIMIINFTSMIPESCLEDSSRSVWVETRPFTSLSASVPSLKPRESSIVKSPRFPGVLASLRR